MNETRYSKRHRAARGRVVLVGAGPGDPRLLTVMGADALGSADVVIYDDLVDPAALALARPGALLLRAGKRAGLPSPSQSEINRLLVAHALRGRTVVRLKGGDPFVFGRGGEEAEALARAGIDFEVVPGVSAGTGIAARVGIPLTHRDVASSVAFVTAEESREKAREPVDWSALARGADTIVVFMCARSVARVARRLVEAGREPSTPVAVVSRGTREGEDVRVATLGELAALSLEAAAAIAPALAIVGEVVALRARLAPPSAHEQEVTYDEIVA